MGDNLGPRKRKKRVRFGEEDSDQENQPPQSMPRTEGDSITAKAEAEMCAQPLGVLGSSLLLDSNFCPNTESPEAEEGVEPTSVEETQEDAMAAVEAWDRPPGVGRPGQLKKIILVNFMCHEHLAMEFGAHVNFISGQNGSGKSAVLQAIQQVLGVRARDTGRATNQAAFIKAGCPEATITITLWNEGPEAYAPDIFGTEIIIERRIGKTASYAIKTAHGRKIGHRREDLDAVLEALQINAANPITVMTQDTTRSFMDGGSGKRDRAKYDIYMEATMLARIEDANAASSAQLCSMSAEVESQKEKHEVLVKQLREVDKALESLNRLEQSKREEVGMQHALAWASVESVRAEVQRVNEQLTTGAPRAQELYAGELAEAKAKVDSLEANDAYQKDALQNHTRDIEELDTEAKALRDEYREALEALKAAGKKVQSRKREEAKAASTQQELMDVAKETQAELFIGNQAAMQAYEAREEELKDRLTKLEGEVSAAASDYEAYTKRMVALHKQVEAAKDRVYHAQKRVEDRDEELARCMRYNTNGGVYKFGGNNATRLVEAIQQDAARFHKAPLGPIGNLMALKDPRWAQTVEAALGNKFDMFIVHDYHDLGALRALCRSRGLHLPACIVASLDLPRHDVNHGLPPPHIRTMLHILTCTQETASIAILNALIDQCTIERQALVLSAGEARSVANARNVSVAWLEDGSRSIWRGPCYTTFPPKRARYARLGADNSHTINGLKQERQDAQAELDEAQRELDRLTQERQALQETRPILARTGQAARDKRRRAEQELRMLLGESKLQPVAAAEAVDGEDSQLAEEIEEATQARKEAQISLLDAESAAQSANEAEMAAKRKWEAAKARVAALEDANKRILEDQTAHVEALKLAREKLDALEQLEGTLQQQLEKLAASKEHLEAVQERHIEKANQVCSEEEGQAALKKLEADLAASELDAEKLAERMAPKVLGQRLAKLQKTIAAQEAEAGGMMDEVQAKRRKMAKQVATSRGHLGSLFSAFQLLKTGLDARVAQYKKMDKLVAETVNRRFNYYLNRKGHNGSIKVLRKKNDAGIEVGALEIKVLIDGSRTQGRVKDLKQLSGGERSFTTVAFALALGEFSGSPFRAMDEFDVFMDAINRQVSLESLLTNAIEHKDLQFIFLTPLDIAAVEGAKTNIRSKGLEIDDGFVRIAKLRPARDTGVQ